MRKAFLNAAAAAVALAASTSSPTQVLGPIEGNSFAIGNVRVFDGGQIIEQATVIVRNGLIDRLGTQVLLPKDLPFVDGTGKTLIPGLIDSHTHNSRDEALADALRFGVTTELNMSESLADSQRHRLVRSKMERTRFADVWSSGTPATSPGGLGTQFGYAVPTISSPEDANEFVGARVAEGADYLKIIYEPGNAALSSSISKEILEALVKAAHARSRLAVVHVTSRAAARDAAAAGVDGLVHVFSDAPIDELLMQEIASKDIFVVATLTAVLANRTQEKPWLELIQDERIAPRLSKNQLEFLKRTPQGGRQIDPDIPRSTLKQLQARGVDVLAGTDAGATTVLHGASLHAELELLVQAGLTPVQALSAATRLPAERFGLKDRGEIRPGRRADLVLVDGDPTTNIKATRGVAGVFKNGYQIDRAVPPASAGQDAAPDARSDR
jgi:imidazolonepropionase-like amidohydrolase